MVKIEMPLKIFIVLLFLTSFSKCENSTNSLLGRQNQWTYFFRSELKRQEAGQSSPNSSSSPNLSDEMSGNLLEENSTLKECYSYIITPSASTWQEAKAYCISQGGTLAFREIRGTMKRRRQIANSFSVADLWIGAYDVEFAGWKIWVWMDGKRVQRSDMHWQKTKNWKWSSDNCASISKIVHWRANGKLCEVPTRGLCEIWLPC